MHLFLAKDKKLKNAITNAICCISSSNTVTRATHQRQTSQERHSSFICAREGRANRVLHCGLIDTQRAVSAVRIGAASRLRLIKCALPRIDQERRPDPRVGRDQPFATIRTKGSGHEALDPADGARIGWLWAAMKARGIMAYDCRRDAAE